jgi:TetR/AcrR family transcriptional repressor of nem operon
MQSENAREAILEATRRKAQAHGYGGLNIRDIAEEAGIKAASIYYHFPGKAELAAAVAKRYWEKTEEDLEALLMSAGAPGKALKEYPRLFRYALEEDNRMCLCSFMAAEYDDLPNAVKIEVQTFADVNVAWLSRMLAEIDEPESKRDDRARAIFASIAGAQLLARSRADIGIFDALVATYIHSGLIPS